MEWRTKLLSPTTFPEMRNNYVVLPKWPLCHNFFLVYILIIEARFFIFLCAQKKDNKKVLLRGPKRGTHPVLMGRRVPNQGLMGVGVPPSSSDWGTPIQS